jgi:hypothetical protein
VNETKYWSVDPEARTVYQFVLEAGSYADARELALGARLESPTLNGVRFQTDDLFR